MCNTCVMMFLQWRSICLSVRVRLLNLRDPFLPEIIEYWTTLNYKDNNQDFTSAQIWHNSLVRIENKPIFYKSWFNAGVKDVKDILDTDGNSILSYTAFTSKYKIKTNFLEFYKVVSALKLFRQKCFQQPNGGPKTKTFGHTLLAVSYTHLTLPTKRIV